MPIAPPQARHVLHLPSSGEDRARAYAAVTGEPVFRWGGPVGPSPFVGGVQRAFRQWLRVHDEAVVTIYHDGVGADALGPLDPCQRKVLFQHRWPPAWERAFNFFIRGTGKVLVEDENAQARIRNVFAWIPDRYFHEVPPVRLPALVEPTVPGENEFVTGIWLQDQRWRLFGNRLRSLADRWPPELGVLELIVSTGAEPRWARKNGVRWISGLGFEAARRRASRWRAVLLFQDEDLLAPWLLEIVRGGAFPLLPDSERGIVPPSWNDEDAPEPYPWGDMPIALERLRQWREAEDWQRSAFRAWADRLPGLEPKAWLENHWWPALARFADQRAPRLRKRRPCCFLYPLRWYERMLRLRAGRG